MTTRSVRVDIPHYRQPNGSPMCGEACLKMIYGMYGIKKSIYDIRQEITKFSGCFRGRRGNLLFELGIHLLQNGFDIEISSWPSYENNFACKRFQSMDQKTLKEALLQLFKVAGGSRTLDCRMMKKFMEKGGKFSTRVATFRELRKRIKSGIIVLIQTSYINSNILPYGGNPAHFVVPVEFKGRKISWLDPYLKNETTVNKEEFLFMLYTLDASVIFVNGPKKNSVGRAS